MESLSGLGKTDRKRLTKIIRNTKGTISVPEAAGILDIPRPDTAKILARWAVKGWVSRIRRGIYVLVPLESQTTDVALEEPWVIAQRIFSPCYIGGWSAAEYWALTEQIFSSVLVLTSRKPQKENQSIRNTSFVVRKVSDAALFGQKSVWKGNLKVNVSDPSKTIIDMLNSPALGGGIRPVTDVFLNYMKSEYKNIKQLTDYALKLNNGAVFKRLGFMLEQYAPKDIKAIEVCKENLTKGNAKLDPSLPSDKLLTRWCLWVSENWKKDKPSD
jgi:predicted transcriptional regulator of viral defense system